MYSDCVQNAVTAFCKQSEDIWLWHFDNIWQSMNTVRQRCINQAGSQASTIGNKSHPIQSHSFSLIFIPFVNFIPPKIVLLTNSYSTLPTEAIIYLGTCMVSYETSRLAEQVGISICCLIWGNLTQLMLDDLQCSVSGLIRDRQSYNGILGFITSWTIHVNQVPADFQSLARMYKK